MTKQQQQYRLMSWVVFFLVPFSGVCVDVYVPSLPHVVSALGVSQTLVQLTIPAFSFGVAFGQLIVGPISDAVGRRSLMILGALLQIFVLYAIVLSDSIAFIIACRVLQGAFLSLLVVPARAILSDIYSGGVLKNKILLMTVFWSLGPIIAPVIGGYLQHAFNWHAPFYFMLAYDVVILCLVIFFIKETRLNKTEFSFRRLRSDYAMLLGDSRVLSTIFMIGVLISYMLLFNLVSPFFVQQVFGYSSIVYGRVALLIGLAWFVGSLLARKLNTFPDRPRTLLTFSFIIVAVSTVAALSYHFGLQLWLLLLLGASVALLGGSLSPTLMANAMQLYERIPATLNALLFSGVWMVAAFITAMASFLKTHSLLPMALCYLVSTVLAFVVYCVYYTKKHKPWRQQPIKNRHSVMNQQCKAL